MSRMCSICGKAPMSGNKVSKSYNHTRRSWRPNLIKVKAQFGRTSRTITICTRCLRSGFVDKKVSVPKTTETSAQ
jgi:large subunit ribosomal protein L28